MIRMAVELATVPETVRLLKLLAVTEQVIKVLFVVQVLPTVTVM